MEVTEFPKHLKKYWKLNYSCHAWTKKSRVEVHLEASKTIHTSSAFLR